MVTIDTQDIERFRTTPRHFTLIREGAVVRDDSMSTANSPSYFVDGRYVGVTLGSSVFFAFCGCDKGRQEIVCDHALAAVEAELVRLFSLGAHAGYRAAKREAVR